MRSEITKWAVLTSGCLFLGLVSCAGGIFALILWVGYYFPNDPAEDRKREVFIYGKSRFERAQTADIFESADLVRDEDGPWLWISESEGVKVGEEDAIECGKRIARQLQLREPHVNNNLVRVSKGVASLTLVTRDGREHWKCDAQIDSRYSDFPISISMKKDGPRISLKCNEEELRGAFGKPTNIIRETVPVAPH